MGRTAGVVYSTLSLVLYASMVMIAEDDRSIGKSATSRKTISRNRPGHKEERYHADTVHCGIVGRGRCETGNIRVLVSGAEWRHQPSPLDSDNHTLHSSSWFMSVQIFTTGYITNHTVTVGGRFLVIRQLNSN